ncbi:lytic transglycosylase domain-containing protein [Pseudonocardia adelaidensis]|uniref:Transglycosylase-like protein with SLT domain n=1 Tax=Pseudonocardia adelaidensis TaxID=648754 RepID=A0ABP9PBU6_9PSEU
MKLVVVAVSALLVVVVGSVAVATAALADATATPAPRPSSTALTDIPADYLRRYQQAATVCPGLDWAVLAAIGKIESDHGRSDLPGVRSGENPYGAAGVMQILPTTWEEILTRHHIPPGGASPPSRYNPHDAIHAAAFYLCDNGAPADPTRAIFAYNHVDSYVQQVLDGAARYRQTDPPDAPGLDGQAVLPDPTGTGGHVTPRMHALYQALASAGATSSGATCWDPHLHNPESDHPRGKACDLFYNPDDPTAVARGWQIAQWLATVHAAYRIRYLIWQGQIWSAQSPTWTTYRSDTYHCPDPNNITGCHYDHIHISVS